MDRQTDFNRLRPRICECGRKLKTGETICQKCVDEQIEELETPLEMPEIGKKHSTR